MRIHWWSNWTMKVLLTCLCTWLTCTVQQMSQWMKMNQWKWISEWIKKERAHVETEWVEEDKHMFVWWYKNKTSQFYYLAGESGDVSCGWIFLLGGVVTGVSTWPFFLRPGVLVLHMKHTQLPVINSKNSKWTTVFHLIVVGWLSGLLYIVQKITVVSCDWSSV